MVKQTIPPVIKNLIDTTAKAYANSPATTNAGRVLRFIARFITVDTVVKLLAHKITNQKI